MIASLFHVVARMRRYFRGNAGRVCQGDEVTGRVRPVKDVAPRQRFPTRSAPASASLLLQPQRGLSKYSL